MTHAVTWRAGQHGCARAVVGRWAPRRARAAGPAAAARAARRGGDGRGGPGGLVRLRRPPAARGPRQRGRRAPLLPGGEPAGPGFCPAASRACQGARSTLAAVGSPALRAGVGRAGAGGGGERWPPRPHRPSRCSGSARSFRGFTWREASYPSSSPPPVSGPSPCRSKEHPEF